eukprot:4094229-Prymnesium_polylepis.1
MAEQPFLRPPTQDYIEKHLRSCTAPAAAKPKHFGTAMRLFEHQANAPEPSDLADYTNRDGVELLMDSAEIKQAAAVADRRRLTLLLLCASQAAAGVGGCFVANGWLISAEVRMMQVTLVLIAFSGVMGFLGAWLRWGDALQGFFITQIWCLSTVFSREPSRARPDAATQLSRGHTLRRARLRPQRDARTPARSGVRSVLAHVLERPPPARPARAHKRPAAAARAAQSLCHGSTPT